MRWLAVRASRMAFHGSTLTMPSHCCQLRRAGRFYSASRPSCAAAGTSATAILGRLGVPALLADWRRDAPSPSEPTDKPRRDAPATRPARRLKGPHFHSSLYRPEPVYEPFLPCGVKADLYVIPAPNGDGAGPAFFFLFTLPSLLLFLVASHLTLGHGGLLVRSSDCDSTSTAELKFWLADAAQCYLEA